MESNKTIINYKIKGFLRNVDMQTKEKRIKINDKLNDTTTKVNTKIYDWDDK